MGKKIIRHPKLYKAAHFGKKIVRGSVKTVARTNAELEKAAIKTVLKNAPDATGFNRKEQDASSKSVSSMVSAGKATVKTAGTAPHQIKNFKGSLKSVKSGFKGMAKGSSEIASGIKLAKGNSEQIRRIKVKGRSLNNNRKGIKTTKKGIKKNVKSINAKSRKAVPKNILKSTKAFKNSVASRTLKTSKAARRTISAAQKRYYIKKTVEKSTKGVTKGLTSGFRIIRGMGRLATAATKTVASLIKLLITGGSAVVAIVAVMIVIILLLSSAFSIFSPNPSSTLTMREAVSRVNQEYNDKVKQLIDQNDDGTIDLIKYEGRRAQWKYVIALFAVKYSAVDDGILTIDESSVRKLSKVFFDMHDIHVSFSQEESGHGTIFNVITVNTSSKTMSEMMDMYHFNEYQRSQVREILDSKSDDRWTELLYGFNGMNTASAFVRVAKEQIGTVGGQIYTSWYGYNPGEAPKELSGIFVSWCADQVGLISQGLFPQFSNVNTGAEWFKNNGMWQQPNTAPSVGDIAFLDYNKDGIADRCCIITSVMGNTAYTVYITDEVESRKITLNQYVLGYGILPQMSGLVGDTVEEQCFNYLKAGGYSDIAACAVIANFQGECSCDPSCYSRDYGDAAGLMMWTGPNKNIFFSWCNDNAMNWRNLESQLNFYDYWLDDVNTGEWSRVSGSKHPDFKHVYSTEEFKQISADDYGGDAARALYEATAMFVDDMERPYDTWGAETRRYTYAVQFYNYLVAGGLDGTTQAAWRPEYANDIGVFHLN